MQICEICTWGWCQWDNVTPRPWTCDAVALASASRLYPRGWPAGTGKWIMYISMHVVCSALSGMIALGIGFYDVQLNSTCVRAPAWRDWYDVKVMQSACLSNTTPMHAVSCSQNKHAYQPTHPLSDAITHPNSGDGTTAPLRVNFKQSHDELLLAAWVRVGGVEVRVRQRQWWRCRWDERE